MYFQINLLLKLLSLTSEIILIIIVVTGCPSSVASWEGAELMCAGKGFLTN